MLATWIRRGIVGGALGGVVMAMVEMTNELVHGHSLFTPMHMIAAPIVGKAPLERAMQGGPLYLEAMPTLLGLIGHFLWAGIVWGIVFGLIASAFALRGTTALVAGMAVGVAAGFVMSALVLPLVGFEPLWQSAGWAPFVLMHVGYGLGPGIVAWLATRDEPSATRLGERAAATSPRPRS